jgi:hypothetical protein
VSLGIYIAFFLLIHFYLQLESEGPDAIRSRCFFAPPCGGGNIFQRLCAQIPEAGLYGHGMYLFRAGVTGVC